MSREGKGSGVSKYVSDYCVVDLETTSVFVSSTSIIEISALKVRNHDVVDEFSVLINPECAIPADATAVNNITDDMVKDAPLLDDVIDDFLAFVGDDVIVGYNNAGFDMNIIYDKVQSLRGKIFANDYIDLLYAFRRAMPELENHRLETISKYYGLDTTGEHRALKDCYLTKDCYDRLFAELGDAAFARKAKKSGRSHAQHFTVETKALRQLQNFLEDIIADGKVSAAEFFGLIQWMAEHRDLRGNYPFDRVFNALDKVLADGRVTSEELEEIQILFSEFVDPVKSQGHHGEIRTLRGMHVVITGDFDYGDRRAVTTLIENAGGIIDTGVKKATNYVVVGAQGSDAWKAGNYGGKIQKAMEYNEKGMDIKIVEEKDFVPAALHLIEHSDENNYSAEESERRTDWQAAVQIMLDEMVIDKELPKQSLYLMENYGRDGKKVTSYSVCIYEPNYPLPPNTKKDPTRNSIVLNIKENKDALELLVSDIRYGDIGKLEGAEEKRIKSDPNTVHLLISKDSSALIPYIKKYTEYALANYVSKASSFGCCSSFNACSDARKCVHENKLYSKACIYRSHLDAGEIFYGKNRNID